jgi:hypothetical protein
MRAGPDRPARWRENPARSRCCASTPRRTPLWRRRVPERCGDRATCDSNQIDFWVVPTNPPIPKSEHGGFGRSHTLITARRTPWTSHRVGGKFCERDPHLGEKWAGAADEDVAFRTLAAWSTAAARCGSVEAPAVRRRATTCRSRPARPTRAARCCAAPGPPRWRDRSRRRASP